MTQHTMPCNSSMTDELMTAKVPMKASMFLARSNMTDEVTGDKDRNKKQNGIVCDLIYFLYGLD